VVELVLKKAKELISNFLTNQGLLRQPDSLKTKRPSKVGLTLKESKSTPSLRETFLCPREADQTCRRPYQNKLPYLQT
jgi:hypothetical protein